MLAGSNPVCWTRRDLDSNPCCATKLSRCCGEVIISQSALFLRVVAKTNCVQLCIPWRTQGQDINNKTDYSLILLEAQMRATWPWNPNKLLTEQELEAGSPRSKVINSIHGITLLMLCEASENLALSVCCSKKSFLLLKTNSLSFPYTRVYFSRCAETSQCYRKTDAMTHTI